MENTDKKKCKVLLVDDVEMNLIILSEIISQMDYEPLTALSAKEAFDILKKNLPQLILLDVSMPDMSGLEFCKILKEDVYTREIPVIFISALDSQDDLSKAFEMGAVDYIFKPFDPNDVRMRVNTHIKLYRMQSELEEANRQLNNILKQRVNANGVEQRIFYQALSKVEFVRDKARTFNIGREDVLVRKLSRAMQFSEKFENVVTESFLENIEIISSMHDIGMMCVPDSIVLKEGPLTEEERDIMKKHVTVLPDILGRDEKMSKYSFGRMFNDVLKYHHECYDGSGYPEGLKGEEIPLAARIMAVIDVYEALVNDRCYRRAMEAKEALDIIIAGAGTQFDPDIVDVFKKIHRQFVSEVR